MKKYHVKQNKTQAINDQVKRLYVIHDRTAPPARPKNLTKKHDGRVLSFEIDEIANGEIFNMNKRRYPWPYLLDSVTKIHYVPRAISTRTCFNEIGHPADTSLERQVVLDRDRAATMITELIIKKPKIGAKFETLATQKGEDYKNLISLNGCNLGYSIRSASELVPVRDGFSESTNPMFTFGWDEVGAPALTGARVGNQDGVGILADQIIPLVPADAAISDEAHLRILYDTLGFDPVEATVDKNGNINCRREEENGSDTLVVATRGGFRKNLLELL